MFKCKNCEREFKRESNRDMHQKFCGTSIENKDETRINKEEKNSCDHDLVMLNPRFSNQRQAMAMGYSAFCRICKELI